jgi:hypothetical protein
MNARNFFAGLWIGFLFSQFLPAQVARHAK